MIIHPEQQMDEFFIGNGQKDLGHHPRYSHLKSIRVGKQAYTIDGKKDNMEHMVPLFVGKSDYEEYNRIWENSLRQPKGK